MKVSGKLRPLRDSVFVTDMEFGLEKTSSGILLHSDDGKTQGIKPRWGKVWAIGPDQTDVNIGDWILVEHGRWTRTVEYEQSDGTVVELRMVDAKAILISSEQKPNDVYRAPA